MKEKFIKYPSPSSSFYTDLEGDLTDSNPRTALINQANSVAGTSTIFTNSDDLYSFFTHFDSISDFIFENIETVTKTPLKTEIQAQIGTTLAAFLNASQLSANILKVWDTIFYQEIVGGDEGFVAKLMMVLRICKIIELIDQNDSQVRFNVGIQTQVNASIILPKPVFPIPKKKFTDANHNDEIDDPADETAIRDAIRTFKSARQDFSEVYAMQKHAKRSSLVVKDTFTKRLGIDSTSKPEDPLKPYTPAELDQFYQKYQARGVAFSLRSDSYRKLKPETIAILVQLGFGVENIVVIDVLKRIDEEIEKKELLLFSNEIKPRLVKVGTSLIRIEPTQYEARPDLPASVDVSPSMVKPNGIGDMLVVRERLLKYEEGEIAHIENILAGERKLRTNTIHTRTETIVERETYNEVLNETDTRSSTQFEMSQAMNSASQSANQSASGISISGQYGPVSANAFAQSSAQSSSSQSEMSATRVAKEVSEKARQRIIESIRELRITSVLRETTDVNEHEIDNTPSADSHKIGQYHWIDKKYLNQVYNIGKRLMYEFLIPEPAAFLIHSLTKSKPTEELPDVPVNPFKNESEEVGFSLSHKLITRTNFGKFAARAKVSGIEPPPAEFVYIGTAVTNPAIEWNLDSYNEAIKVPEGYVASSADVIMSYSIGGTNYVKVKVGTYEIDSRDSLHKEFILDNISGSVPVSVHSGQTYYAVNIVIECSLNDEKFAAWQLTAFNKIMQSYYDAQAEYNYEVERVKRQIDELPEIKIKGYNPERNRILERNELKKHAIKFLTADRYDNFNSMVDKFSSEGFPDFIFQDAIDQGKFIRFFEQAFEWQNITYHHYPYFWGRKKNWVEVLHREDNDPKFSDFLKAGATRVIVPVRPEFTKAMLHYQETGEIWAGQELPALDNELYLSIVEEIKDASYIQDGEPVGEPWVVKLPTNLVRLNSSVNPELPDHSDELL